MTCTATSWAELVRVLQSAGVTRLSQIATSPMRVGGVWKAVIK